MPKGNGNFIETEIDIVQNKKALFFLDLIMHLKIFYLRKEDLNK